MSNCCSCGKYIKVNDESWTCECCEKEHHPKCSGEDGGDGGEYPHDTAYSICKKCINKINKVDVNSENKEGEKDGNN